MRLSNFKLVSTKGSGPLDWEYFATVDVTTGWLFWKTTRREQIRRKYAGFWHFVDTGEFVPTSVLSLARAWEAKLENRRD